MEADSPDTAEPADSDASGSKWLGVRVESKDRMRLLTWLVLLGITAAIGLAVVGLPSFHFPPAPTWEYGIVMPTHGLTRAVTAFARGDLPLAWQLNPASYVLAVIAVATGARLIWGLLTHRWINVSVRFRKTVWIVLGFLVALLWINQQLHADLLITDR